MKPTLTLLLCCWAFVLAQAQPAGPAFPRSPRYDSTTLSNLLHMTPEQRKLFLMTNEAFNANRRKAEQARTGSTPPVTHPPTSIAPGTVPVTHPPTNIAPGTVPLTTPPPAIGRLPGTSTTSAAPSTATSPSAATNRMVVPPPVVAAPPGTVAPVGRSATLPSRFPSLPTAPGGAARTRPGQPGAVPAAAANQPPGSVTMQPTAGGNVAAVVNKRSDEEMIPPGMIHFQEADLNQVLDVYADLTQRTILRPSSLPAVKITLDATTRLTVREGIQALEAVFALNQIATADMGDKFVKVVPSAQVAQTGAEIVTNANKIAQFGPFVTHIVQLKYADPTEVVNVLQPFAQLPNSIIAIKSSQILVLRDYAENVHRMMEMIDKVDVMVPTQYEPVVIPIKYALAQDMQQVLSGLSEGGGGGMTVGGTGSSGLQGGTTGAGFGGTSSRSGTGYPGSSYGAGGYSGGLRPMAASSSLTGARSAFANRLGNIIRSSTQGGSSSDDIQVIGKTKIIADERTNSLLIFADKQDLETITNIINKLDVVLAQVLIESLIMEVNLKDGYDWGLNFKQHSATASGEFLGQGAINPSGLSSFSSFASSAGTNIAGQLSDGFTYVAQFGQDLDVTARAIANDSTAHVISRPRILTSHAKEGSIFVGETRPYVTGTSYGYGYGGSGYSQYQQLEIGIQLSILPFINSEGLVVMDIKQRIQGLEGTVKIDNNDVPVTSDKEATAYIAVRDRDTVILGGYISSDSQLAHSGVPILKDIPLIGALFRSNTKNNSRTEMVVLIRPTVLSTPEAASQATAIERDRLPAIRHAEEQFDSQTRKEEKQLKEWDKKKTKG